MKKNTFVIAEAGVNHNGCKELAKRLIDIAAKAGADAVKFQSFSADTITTKKARQAEYQSKNTQKEDSQYNLLKNLEISKDGFKELNAYSKTKNIKFMSTPFDMDYLDYLVDDLNMEIIKIPSGDVTNAPFLLRAAQKRKKIILSSGMCDLLDIQDALSILAFGYLYTEDPKNFESFKDLWKLKESQSVLRENVSILHCTTEYPAKFEELNLNVLKTFSKEFHGFNIGYSDHSLDIFAPIAAVAMGATIIEKHFTIDTNMEGPDHKASLNPGQLNYMIEGIRSIEKSMGSYEKKPTESEIKNKEIARRSLVANEKIKENTIFSRQNISAKRPGTGISPMKYWDIIGMRSNQDYNADDLLNVDLLK